MERAERVQRAEGWVCCVCAREGEMEPDGILMDRVGDSGMCGLQAKVALQTRLL